MQVNCRFRWPAFSAGVFQLEASVHGLSKDGKNDPLR